MSLGEVDTLNLLTDKLNALFEESQGYYESFLDANNLYKNGKLTDQQFFQKLGDYTVAYSALEFLAIKVIFEIKKSLDKVAGGAAPGATHSPGLMPGMGSPGMMGGMGMSPPPRSGTDQNVFRQTAQPRHLSASVRRAIRCPAGAVQTVGHPGQP